MGALDKQVAQRLALRREVERVRERMTLKHRNTSRWAKHALKHQKHNEGLRTAVTEQLQRGEELRRKQLDAKRPEGDTDSEEDFSDSEAEGEGAGEDCGEVSGAE